MNTLVHFLPRNPKILQVCPDFQANVDFVCKKQIHSLQDYTVENFSRLTITVFVLVKFLEIQPSDKK